MLLILRMLRNIIDTMNAEHEAHALVTRARPHNSTYIGLGMLGWDSQMPFCIRHGHDASRRPLRSLEGIDRNPGQDEDCIYPLHWQLNRD
jgi:hypothetical protein